MNLDFSPKFVKKFAEVGDAIQSALKDYIQEVRSETFPGAEHSYRVERKPLRKVEDADGS